jgi:uncharacterized protein (DUF1015 family)
MKSNKNDCDCGAFLSRGVTAKHLSSKQHQERMMKKKAIEELEEIKKTEGVHVLQRKCFYICDRGIHKGRYLEDVVRFYPNYIDFLITNHKHTFPEEFTDALRMCGVEV